VLPQRRIHRLSKIIIVWPMMFPTNSSSVRDAERRRIFATTGFRWLRRDNVRAQSESQNFVVIR